MKLTKSQKQAKLQRDFRTMLVDAIADFGNDNINSIQDALLLATYSEHDLFEFLITISNDLEISADVICRTRLLGETFAGADFLPKSIQAFIDSENQLPPPPNEIWLDANATASTRYIVSYTDSWAIVGGFTNLELAVNYAKNIHLTNKRNVEVFKIDVEKNRGSKELMYTSEIMPN